MLPLFSRIVFLNHEFNHVFHLLKKSLPIFLIFNYLNMMREEENSPKCKSMCCGATEANREGFASERKSKSLGNSASVISEGRGDIQKE